MTAPAAPRWFVRDVDSDVGDATEIEADDAASAAETAVEHWYDGGRWAGEEMDSEVHVIVRGGDGVEYDVVVTIDWSPYFDADLPTMRGPTP